MSLLLFIAGLATLVVGAELFVRGSAGLAVRFGLPQLVVGLTIVALGTSSPELAVSVMAALRGQADITLGNVVGSNIFNILLVLGASALFAPLVVARQVIRIDLPVMIGASLLLLALAWNGRVSTLEGALLLAGTITYMVLSVRHGRRARRRAGQSFASGTGVPVLTVMIGLGLGLLVLGSHWMVTGAVAIARAVGLSELVIGLTIVSIGTSAPEAAASIVAAMRGHRDLAVGNVVGSNILNVTLVLGVAATTTPGGVAVAPAALRFDLPVMVAVSLACLPIFFTGHRIARWEGALFLTYYAAYTTFLVLDAQHSAAAPVLGSFMAAFAIPLTAVTLVVLAFRALVVRR